MSVPFVKLINTLKAIDDLPMPMDLFNQHRWDYNNILTEVHAAWLVKQPLNVAQAIDRNSLGSQPTAHRRIKELVNMGLVEIYLGEDRRVKYLKVSANGVHYLERCSKMMRKAFD